MRFQGRVRVLAACLTLSAVAAFASTAGEPDTGFDGDGVARTDGGILVAATAVQGDGKVVVAGSEAGTGGGRVWLVRRYTASGALDTAFGTSGEARPFGTLQTGPGLKHMTLDASGRVVATGMAPVEVEVTSGKGKNKTTETQVVARFATIRLDAAGDLDNSFGQGGVAAVAVSDLSGTRGTGVAVQSDGAVVVVGYGDRASGGGGGRRKKDGGGSTTTKVVFVVRLDGNGVLDSSFGEGGVVTNDLGETFAGALALQADGGIVVGSWSADAYAGAPWALTRYDGDGDVDTAFGTRLAPGAGYVMDRLAVDGSDRIVVSGYGPSADGTTAEGLVVRYGAGGALDTDFGSAGTARAGIADRNEGRGGVAVEADGKIVLAGTGIPEDASGASLLLEYAYVARFDADGDLDTGFGDAGIADGIPIADRHMAQALAIDPDGGLFVAGIVAPATGGDAARDWFVARLCD